MKIKTLKKKTIKEVITEEKPTFEQSIQIIEEQIEKRRHKWSVKLNYLDFDDIKQLLFIHIHEKWYQFDPERGELSHWVSSVCSAQLKNHWRNLLGSAVSPCEKCPANEGGEKCRIYQVKDSTKCLLLAKWEKKKRAKYNLCFAGSLDSQESHLTKECDNIHDYKVAQDKISELLKDKLTNKQYKVYKLLYIDNLSDEEAGRIVGHKTIDNKKPGYGIIFSYKKIIIEKVKEIMRENDIV